MELATLKYRRNEKKNTLVLIDLGKKKKKIRIHGKNEKRWIKNSRFKAIRYTIG